jgi:hypothetical protein
MASVISKRPVQYGVNDKGEEIVMVPLQTKQHVTFCKEGFTSLMKADYSLTMHDNDNGTGSRYVKVRKKGTKKGKKERANKVVWELKHGPVPEGQRVKPLNGDWYDLRLSNLTLGFKDELPKYVAASERLIAKREVERKDFRKLDAKARRNQRQELEQGFR